MQPQNQPLFSAQSQVPKGLSGMFSPQREENKPLMAQPGGMPKLAAACVARALAKNVRPGRAVSRRSGVAGPVSSLEKLAVSIHEGSLQSKSAAVKQAVQPTPSVIGHQHHH
jgi:hypothetical protein